AGRLGHPVLPAAVRITAHAPDDDESPDPAFPDRAGGIPAHDPGPAATGVGGDQRPAVQLRTAAGDGPGAGRRPGAGAHL
ncbi:serine/threonine protein kinase, partial [Enterococcus hirae]